MASYGAERTARRARKVCRYRRRFYKRLTYTEFRPRYRAFTYTFCVTAQKKGACHGSLATYTTLRGYRGRTHPNRIGSRSTAQGACLHATTASTALQLDRLLSRRICRRRVARQQWRRIHRSWQHHTPFFFGRRFASNIVPSHSWSDDLGSSFIGGGTLGCNWQPVGSSFVLGLEGEFGYLKLSGEAFAPNTLVGSQTTLDALGSAKVGNWYGMVTAGWDMPLTASCFTSKAVPLSFGPRLRSSISALPPDAAIGSFRPRAAKPSPPEQSAEDRMGVRPKLEREGRIHVHRP